MYWEQHGVGISIRLGLGNDTEILTGIKRCLTYVTEIPVTLGYCGLKKYCRVSTFMTGMWAFLGWSPVLNRVLVQVDLWIRCSKACTFQECLYSVVND